MSGGPDFSLENFNTDDVEVLIGGQPVQVLVEAYAGTKTVARLGHRHIYRGPASRLARRRIRTLAPGDMAVTCENFGRPDRI